MKLCDGNIEKYVRNEYYDLLNPLPPVKRFAKKFELLLDALDFELRDEDEIFGWFVFRGEKYEPKNFTDEISLPDTKQIIQRGQEFGSRTRVDRGHTLINYDSILRDGLISYEHRVDKELAITPNNEYLLAMRDTLESIKKFVSRMIDEVNKKIACCDSESEKKTLLEIKDSLKTVPYYPARNFRDAIQSIWIIHFLTPLAEDAWYSISLGRFDQYVTPYYQRSIENGMTESDAKKILYHFYQLLNSYADGACVLNVGGEDYNELSELLIECQKEFSLPAPILAARITDHTPERIWNLLIDEELFSRGQPTFYGERSCVNALIEKGVAPNKAKTFSNNSCMGIGFPSEEFSSMWGCVFSVSSALEAALNCGTLVTHTCDLKIPDVKKVENLNDVYSEFEKCAAYLLDISLQAYLKQAHVSEKTRPDCFVSLLTEGCIEKRCDRISGAKYHNVTVECMGMVNVSDGIYAINKLAFESKKYTLEEINTAVKNNFVGYDVLRNDILACSKFGQNADADEFAIKVAEILQKIIRSHDHENLFFSPSLHTLDVNIREGQKWGAGYDGRLSGEPFAKNSGASNYVRQADPTSLVLSATKLPQHKFFGGQPIDISFDRNLVKNHKKEISVLIQTYLQNGGLQFQVNALSSKLLRCAVVTPERYPNLIVRIGGYSLYFNELSPASKNELIERLEKEGH